MQRSRLFPNARLFRFVAVPLFLPAAAALLLPPVCRADVADRIAVVVGKTVITETEVLDEVRITEFLNQRALDLGPEARRAAAERLVDQQLIRNEMELGRYAEPSPAEADALIQQYRRENYPSTAQFQAALQKYGITEEQLKRHLLWQQAAIQFTDVRFRPGAQPAGDSSEVQSANRMRAGAAEPASDAVDRAMDAWLKETRANTKVQFKKEAFQ